MHRLIHFRLCPFSRSIRLALAEQKTEVKLEDEKPWDWRAEFLALNPSGELPVLCHRLCGVANHAAKLRPELVRQHHQHAEIPTQV